MNKAVIDDLLTAKEAASFLKVSCSWLAKERITGDGPRFIKIGHAVRYSRQELEEFKRATTRGSTSEYERRPGPGRPPRGNARTLSPRSSLASASGPQSLIVNAQPSSAPPPGETADSNESTGLTGKVEELK